MTAKTFDLKYPFDFKGATYESFSARRPRVHDVRTFLKNLDKDPASAMEKVLSSLFEVDEPIVAMIDIADYAPMKKWFEEFLRPLMDDSAES